MSHTTGRLTPQQGRRLSIGRDGHRLASIERKLERFLRGRRADRRWLRWI